MPPLLLAHFRRMQDRMRTYIIPEDYVDRDGAVIRSHKNDDTLEEKHKLIDLRAHMFANDLLHDLDGPEQREAQAEAEFDYLAETELTASGMDGRHQVSRDEIRRALVTFIEASEKLDLYKKALFRGRNRKAGEIAGLPALPDHAVGFTLDAYWAPEDLDLLHGIIGVATEAGELAEVGVKYLNGQKPDTVNVREEIGDVLWYLARLVKWAGTTFFDEMRRNIFKLRERHGDKGFNVENDKNRNLGGERVVLESGAPRTAYETPVLEKLDPAEDHVKALFDRK